MFDFVGLGFSFSYPFRQTLAFFFRKSDNIFNHVGFPLFSLLWTDFVCQVLSKFQYKLSTLKFAHNWRGFSIFNVAYKIKVDKPST